MNAGKPNITLIAVIGLLVLVCISCFVICAAIIGGVYYLANRTDATSATASTETAAPTPEVFLLPTATVEPPIPTAEPTQARSVTVTWWHINTDSNQKALWQRLADEYTAAHPNVTIEIAAMENESFKTKLTTVMQSGEPPDIFQSWGGDVMNKYAAAGLLKDISEDLDADGGAWRNTFGQGALGVYSLNGRNYGVPWDMGMVGLWYNKVLFAQAGINAPAATWTEFLDDVKALKAAGIVPIALGEGDKWPGMFWYEYLATRLGGKDAFDAAYSRSGSFADPPFVEAGKVLQELTALSPFQDGFLGATYGDEATIMGNGEAAMELMGQWAPAVDKDNSVDPQVFSENLGWFPFPMVEGGAGDPNDAFGGGNGFAIGKDASPEAVDFVKYLTRAESLRQCAQDGWCIPPVKGGDAGFADPFMIPIQQTLLKANYLQLYYDQYLPPAMGYVIMDSVQGIFAGVLTPEQAAQAVEDSARQELR
jgi:raffinose/stachyose/melibiose transport system substrate-binding protein